MKNEIIVIARFLKFHAGGDNKLYGLSMYFLFIFTL